MMLNRSITGFFKLYWFKDIDLGLELISYMYLTAFNQLFCHDEQYYQMTIIPFN